MEGSAEPGISEIATKTVGDKSTEAAASNSDISSQSTDRSNDSENKAESSDPRANRLKLFNKVMEKCLQRVIADASFHRFAKSFHPFYKRDHQLTEGIHRQFISDLQTTIQDDITQLMEEGDLQRKLEELDRLEQESKGNPEPVWRPSGVPEEDLVSFVMPYYLKQREYLRRELKKLQKENASLAQRVQAGRESVAETERRIASSVDEWTASTASLEALSSLSPMQNFDSL
ncbi:hypothetical protein GJAV_G00104800 [Gymnothorax javanicus]|nr:hypothetical protein GJAV_G00104800 [Gymnothorax javanicus]